MNPLSPHTRLRTLYNKYLYMDDKAYYDKIRFYEQNEQDVLNMRLEDSLWIQAGYLEALFDTADFKKYCDKSQDYLERLIFFNITYFHGENPYLETLHHRAEAQYQLEEYETCERTCKEILKMNPERKDSRKLLFQAFRGQFVFSQKLLKAGLLTTLLLTAFVLVFQQLVIVPFYPSLATSTLEQIAKITIPVFGLLVGFKLFLNFKSYRKASSYVTDAAAIKAAKK